MSPAAPRRSLPGTVWALGTVSLLMDSSSEMVHALLPLFMTGVLGASMLEVGLIEGIAEGIAAIVKVFSGTLSDWLGRRKPLVAFGYGLAALSKPLFPLAHSIGLVAGARFMDRIGKGIRGAPRDALIADVVAPELRGAAYGLRQALDSVGAVLGPLAAVALMALAAASLRAVLRVAARPPVPLPERPAALFVGVVVGDPRVRVDRMHMRAHLARHQPRRDREILVMRARELTAPLVGLFERGRITLPDSGGLPVVTMQCGGHQELQPPRGPAPDPNNSRARARCPAPTTGTICNGGGAVMG